MTYLDLCKRVRSECGIGGTGPSSVDSQIGDLQRIVQWVNQAYLDIQKLWTDWKFLFAEGSRTLVIGTATYSADSDLQIWQEDSVYVEDTTTEDGPQRLVNVDYDDYRRDKTAYDTQNESGREMPTHFVILPDRKIRLFPTPNKQYELTYEYQKKPTSMVANTDAPVIPAEFQDTIIWRSKILWAQFEEAQAEFAIAAQLYDEALTRLEAHQLPDTENMHSRAQGVDIVVRPY